MSRVFFWSVDRGRLAPSPEIRTALSAVCAERAVGRRASSARRCGPVRGAWSVADRRPSRAPAAHRHGEPEPRRHSGDGGSGGSGRHISHLGHARLVRSGGVDQRQAAIRGRRGRGSTGPRLRAVHGHAKRRASRAAEIRVCGRGSRSHRADLGIDIPEKKNRATDLRTSTNGSAARAALGAALPEVSGRDSLPDDTPLAGEVNP